MNSSFKAGDVTLLLKDITGRIDPLPTQERERRIPHSMVLQPESMVLAEFFGTGHVRAQFRSWATKALAYFSSFVFR